MDIQRFTVTLLLLVIASCTSGPRISTETPILRQDPEVTIGKLDNGLTYYIRPNKKPESRAELRLVVRAGSVLEDDDQQGLAHFIEHMAFNGTKSFPKNEIVNFLERTGVRFGSHLNAYTSFDETVYMLQVPTDTIEIVAKALQILREWAADVSFDEEEIEKERGVIIEEWRSRKGAGDRVFNQHVPKLYHGSKYTDRLPIGKPEIIQSAKRETFRRFYNDWYRPNLMAVVAVGDFDKTEIEAQIHNLFSSLKNPEPKRTRPEHILTTHGNPLVSIVPDPELTYASVNLLFKRGVERYPYELGAEYADRYRAEIARSLYDGMLNDRLAEIARHPNPPFLWAQAGDPRLVGGKEAFSIGAAVDGNKLMEGFQAIVAEVYRAKQHGFTETELERQKKVYLSGLEYQYNERNKRDSGGRNGLVNDLVSAFLNDEPVVGIESRYALAQAIVPALTLQEINKVGSSRVASENRVVLVGVPQKEGASVPSEADLLGLLAEKQMDPYVDKVITEPLVAAMPKKGNISSERELKPLGVTEWKLSNGATVVFKSTDFKNDEILFSAFSKGGTSLSSDSDYWSAAFSSAVISQSGLGSFDATTLQKVLAGKRVRLNPWVGSTSHGLQGAASPQDLEALFQLAYLHFTSPRKDSSAFVSLLTRQRSVLQNRSASPTDIFSDTLQITLGSYHFRAYPLTPVKLSDIDLEKTLSFYKDRFDDACNFVFFFVGNIDVDSFRSLVRQYIASLPSQAKRETWRDVGMGYPNGRVQKIVEKGIEEKSQVRMVFTGDFEWTHRNSYNLDALTEVLNLKLRESLREELGGVYGVGVGGSSSREPRNEYRIDISFTCDPRRVQELKQAVHKHIDSLKSYPVTDDYITKVKQQQRRSWEVNLKENNFWLRTLQSAWTNTEDPAEALEYPKLVDGLTAPSVQESARKYLNQNNVVTAVLNPEPRIGSR